MDLKVDAMSCATVIGGPPATSGISSAGGPAASIDRTMPARCSRSSRSADRASITARIPAAVMVRRDRRSQCPPTIAPVPCSCVAIPGPRGDGRTAPGAPRAPREICSPSFRASARRRAFQDRISGSPLPRTAAPASSGHSSGLPFGSLTKPPSAIRSRPRVRILADLTFAFAWIHLGALARAELLVFSMSGFSGTGPASLDAERWVLVLDRQSHRHRSSSGWRSRRRRAHRSTPARSFSRAAPALPVLRAAGEVPSPRRICGAIRKVQNLHCPWAPALNRARLPVPPDRFFSCGDRTFRSRPLRSVCHSPLRQVGPTRGSKTSARPLAGRVHLYGRDSDPACRSMRSGALPQACNDAAESVLPRLPVTSFCSAAIVSGALPSDHSPRTVRPLSRRPAR